MNLTARILFLAAALGCAPALADVTVQNSVLQRGLFQQAGCTPESAEGFNECLCQGNIEYPVISGMADEEQQRALNDAFVRDAQQHACNGQPATLPEGSKTEPASSSYNVSVTYQSPALLALKFEGWEYSGGAHGNGATDGELIDLTNGQLLAVNDIFAEATQPALNQYVYDTLSARPEGEVFHDSIEGFEKQFIAENSCRSCTLLLTQDGLKIVFDAYAVACFACGPIEVPVPAHYVSYPALKDTLTWLAAAQPAASAAPATTPALQTTLPETP